MSHIFNEIVLRNCLSAKHKEIDQLSEMEKVCICMASGCEIDIDYEGSRMTMKTRNPVGIVKIEGQFKIFERRGHK